MIEKKSGMGERINCPVCEKKIPSDARYCCFYCGFDISMANDKKAVGKAKKHFEVEKIGTEKEHQPLFNVAAGVVLGLIIVSAATYVFNPSEGFSVIFLFLTFLPFGLLVGFSIYILEKIIRKLNHRK